MKKLLIPVIIWTISFTSFCYGELKEYDITIKSIDSESIKSEKKKTLCLPPEGKELVRYLGYATEEIFLNGRIIQSQSIRNKFRSNYGHDDIASLIAWKNELWYCTIDGLGDGMVSTCTNEMSHCNQEYNEE